MINIIIFLIIITITIINIIDKLKDRTTIIEGYDDRYTDMSVTDCAQFCKTTAGCFGFGYDPRKKTCYPAKDTLLGPPLDPNTLFRASYNPNNVTCNKIDPIIEPNKYVPFDKRRSNSLYVCSERQGMQPLWYLHSRDRLRDIGEGAQIDEIFDVDIYNVRNHKWPINKYDFNNFDLLYNDRVSQELTPHTVTDMDRIEGMADLKSMRSTYLNNLRAAHKNLMLMKKSEKSPKEIKEAKIKDLNNEKKPNPNYLNVPSTDYSHMPHPLYAKELNPRYQYMLNPNYTDMPSPSYADMPKMRSSSIPDLDRASMYDIKPLRQPSRKLFNMSSLKGMAVPRIGPGVGPGHGLTTSKSLSIWEQNKNTNNLDIKQYPKNDYMFDPKSEPFDIPLGIAQDSSITNTQNLRENRVRRIKESLFVPDIFGAKNQELDEVPIISDRIDTNSNNKNNKCIRGKINKLYKIYDDYNTGPYLHSYKCLPDITRENCLKYCESNKYCTGVEWNPSFKPYQNVCCPKTFHIKGNIGSLVPRKFEHRYGRFYKKEDNKSIHPNDIYVQH
jgi:hypothetical protein